MLQGLRNVTLEAVGRDVAVLETLDGRAEEFFRFGVQIEEPPFEEVGQPCSCGRLADAGDTANEYPHVPNPAKSHDGQTGKSE